MNAPSALPDPIARLGPSVLHPVKQGIFVRVNQPLLLVTRALQELIAQALPFHESKNVSHVLKEVTAPHIPLLRHRAQPGLILMSLIKPLPVASNALRGILALAKPSLQFHVPGAVIQALVLADPRVLHVTLDIIVIR